MKVIYEKSIQDRIMEVKRDADINRKVIGKIIVTEIEMDDLCDFIRGLCGSCEIKPKSVQFYGINIEKDDFVTT